MVTEQLEPDFATVPDKTLMKWVWGGGGGATFCVYSGLIGNDNLGEKMNELQSQQLI